MPDFFLTIYSFLNRKKFFSIGIALATLLVLGFFASKITFQENITQLIPSNDQSGITSKVLQQVNFADKITIIINTNREDGVEDLTGYADQFIDSLNLTCKPYVGKLQGKIEDKNIQETIDFVYNNLPLFLDKDDYTAIQNKIQDDSIAQLVEGSYKSLISPTGIISKDYILRDPLGLSFIALKKFQQLSVGDDFELQNGYVVTKDKKNLLLFITPALAANETDKNTLFIKHLKSIKNNLNTKFSGKATMSYFGATPVAVANATQIKADVRSTSLFAIISLILILAFFYRSVITPVIIFIPSLFGAAFALAVLYFTKDSISAISLGISSILLGETTDYSIYVLTHLRNNRDVKLLYKDITKPLIMCGATTAITFLCLFFVKSEALKDLGIFAALSVFATSVFSLLLIPLLYKAKEKGTIKKANIIDKVGTYSYHKNKFLVGAVFVVLVVCFFTYSKVTFNNDLSALNYIPADLKKTENDLEKIANNASKSIYLVTYGNSYSAALENNNRLFDSLAKEKKNAEILNFSSVGGLVFSDNVQTEKIKEWNAFWDNDKKSLLTNKLIASGNKYGFKSNSFASFYETLDKKFLPIPFEEYGKLTSLFLEEFTAKKNGFYTVSTLVKVPNEKRDAFVSKISKHKDIVVIDRQQTNETFLAALKNNFVNLVDYSIIAIFLILLFAFKRIELAIISIIPVMISWIFTTGIMGLLHLQFNIINIIVCTLIFGIGVDYSIFMTTALQKEHTYGRKELPTYRTSILLSVATTILGIGVLIIAKHPALKSIALIAIIGIFSALVITFVIQPLLFNFWITNRVKKGKPPYQLRTFLYGIFSFTYYGLGGIIMSLYAMTIMRIIPGKEVNKTRRFRYVMSKFMKSVLYTNPFLRKKVINPRNERFDKPAIIIANHTSFLDILSVGMLSHKIIYLVSDWVYNSPIFGAVVRRAGFYPVSEGLEDGVEHLTEKVKEGYSIIIFPEGTRSTTNQIHRFHKGAFFLAEHLSLDIIPVIIHGNSEALPKGDFIIYDGKQNMKILDRITPDNKTYGENYTERTKKISTYFKQEFNKMRSEIEDAGYFSKTIINSFDYKEIEVVRAARKHFVEHTEIYTRLNKFIGPKAKVLRLSNDHGALDALLTMQEPQRKIDSFILDIDKRAVATTNYITNIRTIKYIENKEEFLKTKYDVVLISDASAGNYVDDVIQATDKIILVGDLSVKDRIVNLGFIIEHGEDQLTILKKSTL